MLRNFFSKRRKRNLLSELRDISFAEGNLRRATGFVLCFVIIGLTGISIVLNYLEGNHGLILPLGLVVLSACVAFFWLYMKKDAELGPQYICLGALTTLGIFLLFWQGAPNGSSLFWFLLFPSMIMFCLGIRRGTIIFCSFLFFSLLLLMMTPLQTLLAESLPQTVRVRFLAAMLGAFVFSAGTEYTRYLTQKALARTVARLELDSLTDPLTGLGNRRNFYNFYNISFLGSPARNYPVSLAIADIDHFKNVNDAYGHEVGDKVLCHVASVLRSQCREADKLYRWGGEEFLILMPRTNNTEAQVVLERIRGKLEKTPYCGADGKTISFTSSFGVYSGSAEENLELQLSAADQNLYAAKRGGRNRVV